MVSMRWSFFLSFIFIFQSLSLFAQNEASDAGLTRADKMKIEIKEVIDHHLGDDYELSFLSDKEGNYWSIPLPVILFDDGLKIFSSSEFVHGTKVVEKDGNHYAIYHGHIYKTDASGEITLNEKGIPQNAKPLDFSITKSVVYIIITCLIMLLIFIGLARSYGKNGGIAKGVGRFFEPVVMYIKDEIAIPNIGEKRYKKYMPFLLTVFFLIWILNMFGLTPLGVNVTGNIAATTALALLTFLITNFTGTKTYWRHIFDPLGDSMPWYGKLPLYIILIPIEILGVFLKPFTLLIRLFANMAAGHVVLLSLVGLIFIFSSWFGSSLSFLLTFVIVLIKVLVSLIQAYIFTMLSALYFGFASAEHEAQEAH